MAHALNRHLFHEAHRALAFAIRAGDIAADPGPCVVCGATVQVDRHHPDYAKPLWTIALCRSHHIQVHNGTIKEPETGRRYPRKGASPAEVETIALKVCRRVEAVGGVTNLQREVRRFCADGLTWRQQESLTNRVRSMVKERGALRHRSPVKGTAWVRTDLPLAQAFPLAHRAEAA